MRYSHRAEYRAQMELLSRGAFSHHEPATRAGGAAGRGLDGGALGWHAGRVCIMRPGTSTYMVEVVWLRCARLLVHGDIAPVIFAARGEDFRGAVHRLAASHADHVADKVTAGERADCRGVDRDILLADLGALRQDAWRRLEAAGGRGVSIACLIDALDAALACAEEGNVDGARAALTSHYDTDVVGDLGRVIPTRVWYAHAALRRVDELHGWRCLECVGTGSVAAASLVPGGRSTCPACGGRGAVNDRPTVACAASDG